MIACHVVRREHAVTRLLATLVLQIHIERRAGQRMRRIPRSRPALGRLVVVHGTAKMAVLARHVTEHKNIVTCVLATLLLQVQIQICAVERMRRVPGPRPPLRRMMVIHGTPKVAVLACHTSRHKHTVACGLAALAL